MQIVQKIHSFYAFFASFSIGIAFISLGLAAVMGLLYWREAFYRKQAPVDKFGSHVTNIFTLFISRVVITIPAAFGLMIIITHVSHI
jgi:hypothetical protein